MSDPLSIPNTKTNILDNKQNSSFKTPEKILENIKLSRSSTNGSPAIIPLMKMTDPHIRRSMTSYNYTPHKKFEINNKVSSTALPYKTNQKRSSSSLSAQSLAVSATSFLFSPSNDNSYGNKESFKRRKNNSSNNDSNNNNDNSSDSCTTGISDPIYPQPKLSSKALLTMLKSNSFLKKRSKNNHNTSLHKVPPAGNDQNTKTDDEIVPQTTNTTTAATKTIINNSTSHEHDDKKDQTNDNKNTATEIKLSSIEDNIKNSIDKPMRINLILPFKYKHRAEHENSIRTPNKNISFEQLIVKNPFRETPTSSKDSNTLPVPMKIPILNKNGKITPHKPIKTPTTLSPNFLLSNSKNKLKLKINTINESVTKVQSKLSESNPFDNTVDKSQNEETLNSLVFKATPTKTYKKETNYTKQKTFQHLANTVNIFNPMVKKDETPKNNKDNTALLSQVDITCPQEKVLGSTAPITNIKDNSRDNNNTSPTEKQQDTDNSIVTNDKYSEYTSHNTLQKIKTVKLTPEKMGRIFEKTQNVSKNVHITMPHDKDTSASNIDNNNNDKIISLLVTDNENTSLYNNAPNENTVSADVQDVNHANNSLPSKLYRSTTNTPDTNITIHTDKVKTDIQNSQIKSTEATTNNKSQTSNLKDQDVEKQNVSNVEENKNFFHLDNNFSLLSNNDSPSIQKYGPHSSIPNSNLDKSKNQKVKAPKVTTTISNDLISANNASFPSDDISFLLQNKSNGTKKEEIPKNKTTLKRKRTLNKESTENKENKMAKVTSTNLQENSLESKHASDMKNWDDLLNSKKNESIALKNNPQTLISNKNTPKRDRWRQFLNDSPLTSVIATSSLLNTLSDIYNTSKREHNTLASLGDSINIDNLCMSYNNTIGSSQKLSDSDQRETERPENSLKTFVVDITPEMKIESFDELNIPPMTNSMKMGVIYISDSDSENEDKDNSKTGDKTSLDDDSDFEIFDNKYNSTQLSEEAISPSFLHNVDPHIERKKFEYGFTTLAYNKVKDKTKIPKNIITDLICDGIIKYTPLNKNNIVSVSNDICSSNNFQFSHTAFYQQLHKRDRIHYISIDSRINTLYLKGKYTILPPINETKIIENEQILSPRNNKTDSNRENTSDENSKEVIIPKSKSSATKFDTDRVTPSSYNMQTNMHVGKIVAKDKSKKDHQTNIPNSVLAISNHIKNSKEIWRKVWLTNLEGSNVYFRNENFFDDEMEQVKYVFINLFKCVPNVLLNSTVDIIILGEKESSSEYDQNTVLLEKYRFIMNKLAPEKKIRIWTYEKAIKFIKAMGINIKTISENGSTFPFKLTATKSNYTKINNNIDTSPENDDQLINNTIQNEFTKIPQKQQDTMQIIDNKVNLSKNNFDTSGSVNIDKDSSTDNINKNLDAHVYLSQTKLQEGSSYHTETINTKHEKENQELIKRNESVSCSQPTKEEVPPKLSNESCKKLEWVESKDTNILSTLESGQKEFDNLQSPSINQPIFSIVNLMVNSLDKAADIIDKKSQELQTANLTIKALCSQILQQQYELASLHAIVETQKKRLTEGENKRKELTVKWMQAIIKNQTLELSKGKEREN